MASDSLSGSVLTLTGGLAGLGPRARAGLPFCLVSSFKDDFFPALDERLTTGFKLFDGDSTGGIESEFSELLSVIAWDWRSDFLIGRSTIVNFYKLICILHWFGENWRKVRCQVSQGFCGVPKVDQS